MRTCYCTLPITNPKACETCPQNDPDANQYSTDVFGNYLKLDKPKVKTRTTEEYDKEGRLIRKTIEEL